MDINITETSAETAHKLIAIQITKTMYDELRRVAFLKDMTLSATIRSIVEEYLEKESEN